MIDLDEAVIDVGRFQDGQVFRSKAKASLDGVNGLQDGGTGKRIGKTQWSELRSGRREENLRISGRLGAALSLVIHEVERLVLPDGPSQRGAELILA